MSGPPSRRLHRLRGGDGPSVPGRPPELWPDFGDLEPFWESFSAFARSELDDPTVRFELKNHGKWRFVARDRPRRSEDRRQQLVYEPEEDVIRFSDPEVDSGWVLEDAFGGDPYSASSAL